MASVSFAALAADPYIGMSSAQRGVRIDRSPVAGGATVFEGSLIEVEAFSRIYLKSGTRVDLGAAATARIFSDHLLLQSGMAEVQRASNYEVDAQLVIVKALNGGSIVRVKLSEDRVFVTALNGPASVLNRKGILVARVSPGSPMSFRQQPNPAVVTAFKGDGCVLAKSGSALLVDPVLVDDKGKVLAELIGYDMRLRVGNQAHIEGGAVDQVPTPESGAPIVVKVARADIVRRGGCSDVAKRIEASVLAASLGAAVGAGAAQAAGGSSGTGGAAAGSGGAAVGLSTGAIAGIVVGAAATVAGAATAAAGAFSSSSP